MPQTVIVTNEYPVSPKQLWDVVIDGDKFEEIMEGIATFDGMPSGKIYTGQHIVVDVSVLGIFPKQKYEMQVVECDEEKMVFRSSEKGAGIKSWKHTGTVTATVDGSLLRDEIAVDAGLMTPIYALWAKYVYTARHKPRLRILTQTPS